MKKATLTIEVEYNEKATDPEAIASAANTLLDTAFSALGPDILDEYGKPHFGGFLVRPKSTAWVLYHLDADEIVGGHVYRDYAEARHNADQVNDLLILPIDAPKRGVASDEGEEDDESVVDDDRSYGPSGPPRERETKNGVYTVVGYWTDTHESFVSHVRSCSPQEAIDAAIRDYTVRELEDELEQSPVCERHKGIDEGVAANKACLRIAAVFRGRLERVHPTPE